MVSSRVRCHGVFRRSLAAAPRATPICMSPVKRDHTFTEAEKTAPIAQVPSLQRGLTDGKANGKGVSVCLEPALPAAIGPARWPCGVQSRTPSQVLTVHSSSQCRSQSNRTGGLCPSQPWGVTNRVAVRRPEAHETRQELPALAYKCPSPQVLRGSWLPGLCSGTTLHRLPPSRVSQTPALNGDEGAGRGPQEISPRAECGREREWMGWMCRESKPTTAKPHTTMTGLFVIHFYWFRCAQDLFAALRSHAKQRLTAKQEHPAAPSAWPAKEMQRPGPGAPEVH